MTFTLPFPPLLNRYYLYLRGGRVLSKEGRAYKLAVLVRAKAQGAQPVDGELCVSLAFYRKAKRGDIDAGLKALLDSGNGVLWLDDKQIRELHAYQLEDPANPRVCVSINQWRKTKEDA